MTPRWWSDEQAEIVRDAQARIRARGAIYHVDTLLDEAMQIVRCPAILEPPGDGPSGTFVRTDFGNVIVVRGDPAAPRTRWTALHELAHALLHDGWDTRPGWMKEHEAELFTVETISALAPDEWAACKAEADIYMGHVISGWRNVFSGKEAVMPGLWLGNVDPHPIPACVCRFWNAPEPQEVPPGG